MPLREIPEKIEDQLAISAINHDANSLNVNADEPEADDESWMLTYTDVVTLLLTLFVMLFLLANLDDEGYTSFTKALSEAAGGDPPTSSQIRHVENIEDVAEASDSLIPADSSAVVDNIRSQIADEGLEDLLSLDVIENSVSLQIKDNVLYSFGSADLTAEGQVVLEKLTPVLNGSGGQISVEGHTDNIPISTPRFPSNWDLSAARASTVVRQLIVQGIAPDRLRAVGYADTKPVAGNETPDGQAQNRRVNLILEFETEASTQK